MEVPPGKLRGRDRLPVVLDHDTAREEVLSDKELLNRRRETDRHFPAIGDDTVGIHGRPSAEGIFIRQSHPGPAPVANRPERGVYALQPFESPQANRFVSTRPDSEAAGKPRAVTCARMRPNPPGTEDIEAIPWPATK